LISSEFYLEFALPYERRVISAIKERTAWSNCISCGNTKSLGADMIYPGPIFTTSIHLFDFRCGDGPVFGRRKGFQGNTEPVADVLQSGPDELLRESPRPRRKARGSRFMLRGGCESPRPSPTMFSMPSARPSWDRETPSSCILSREPYSFQPQHPDLAFEEARELLRVGLAALYKPKWMGTAILAFTPKGGLRGFGYRAIV